MSGTSSGGRRENPFQVVPEALHLVDDQGRWGIYFRDRHRGLHVDVLERVHLDEKIKVMIRSRFYSRTYSCSCSYGSGGFVGWVVIVISQSVWIIPTITQGDGLARRRAVCERSVSARMPRKAVGVAGFISEETGGGGRT